MADIIEHVTVIVSFNDGTVSVLRLSVIVATASVREERNRTIEKYKQVIDYITRTPDAVIICDGKIVDRETAIAEYSLPILDAYRKFKDWVSEASAERIERELDRMAEADPIFSKENRAKWRIVDDADLPKSDRPLWRDTGDAIVVDTGLLPVLMKQIEAFPEEKQEAARSAVMERLSEESRAAIEAAKVAA